MVKCPYCGYEGEFKVLRAPWGFRNYEVRRLQCPKCNGIFNHYKNTATKGKPEFVIRVNPRPPKRK